MKRARARSSTSFLLSSSGWGRGDQSVLLAHLWEYGSNTNSVIPATGHLFFLFEGWSLWRQQEPRSLLSASFFFQCVPPTKFSRLGSLDFCEVSTWLTKVNFWKLFAAFSTLKVIGLFTDDWHTDICSLAHGQITPGRFSRSPLLSSVRSARRSNTIELIGA